MTRAPRPLTDAELAVVARRIAAGTLDDLDAGMLLEQLQHARATLRMIRTREAIVPAVYKDGDTGTWLMTNFTKAQMDGNRARILEAIDAAVPT